FRGGVEVVVVDAAVVDDNSRPITDLKASDFTVIAAKRPRRIVSAEYVSARSQNAVPAPALANDAPTPPGPTSNTQASGARSFLFAVDIEEMGLGEGGSTLHTIGDYLDRLQPNDLAGLVSLPYGTPRID